MREKIDCLLIGYNDMDINMVSKNLEMSGKDSVLYRDFNLSFIEHDSQKFDFKEMYNYIHRINNPNFSEKDHLDISNIFSQTIAYLGTYLYRRELTFDYINSFQLEKDKLIDILLSKEVLTIVITTTFYTHYLPIFEILSTIRQYNQTSKIIIGGPFIEKLLHYNQKTANIYFKKMNADFYVVSSQGEETLVNIINCLKDKGDVSKLNNIYYRQDNNFIWTSEKCENNNLEYNMVNWQLFKDDLPSLANVRSAISCPFKCGFCGFPERAGKHYTVSVKALENELNTLKDTNVKSVYFIDDTFNVPQQRFKEILRMIIKNRYPFKWNSFLRCQFVDRETLDLMAESGCEGVNLGLESGNQQQLKNMNKKVTVDLYRKGLQLLSEYDFIKLATFIIGYPGETEQSVKDTELFIKECELDYIAILTWFCDPITPIYRDGARYNLNGSNFDWSHSTMDSETAIDHVYKLFQRLNKHTFGPPMPFGNQLPFTLYQKCKDFSLVKDAIRSFNDAVQYKIQFPEKKEISASIFQNLQSSMLRVGHGV